MDTVAVQEASELDFSAYRVDRSRPGWQFEVVDLYNQRGLVTFQGIGDRSEFVDLLSMLGRVFPHRDSEADGLTRIASDGKGDLGVGYRGFSTDGMELHTDQSGADSPPPVLAMWCRQQATVGGQSILVDGRELFCRCRKFNPTLFAELSRPKSVVFGGSAKSYLGSVFQLRPNGRWEVRLRTDELGLFAPNLATRLPELKGMLAALAVTFTLRPGEAYVIGNDRWLHGRSQFVGTREMYRGLLTVSQGDGIGSNLLTGFDAK